MRKAVTLVTVIMVFALAAPSLAQMGPGGPEGGPGMKRRGLMGPNLYNPQTVTTLTGTVESLGNMSGAMRGAGGRMGMKTAVLKTDSASTTVFLGPDWYLQEQKFPLKVGDALEVTGSQVTLRQQPVLIARDIKVGKQTLSLRDEQGLPRWRGMGPAGGMGPGGAMGPGGGTGPAGETK
jgi:hypothetical protein